MEKYYLVRHKLAKDESGLLGEIQDYYGNRLCYTFELPNKGNARDVSCIPLGYYECSVEYDHSKSRRIHVNNVPNRDGILIHKGNGADDTQGCILVGKACGFNGVYNCVPAFEQLLMLLPDKFILQIKES